MEKEAVWIEDMAEAFEQIDANWKAYVDISKGDILFVPLKEEDLEEYSQEEKDLFYEIDALKQYIQLPTQKELREFDIMEEYAQGCANLGYKKHLMFALNNTKPFRNFRAQLRLLGLEEDYAYYRYMAFAAKARIWCKENDVPYQVDSDEIRDYFKEIEEDEQFEQDFKDFEDSLDEFEYDDE